VHAAGQGRERSSSAKLARLGLRLGHADRLKAKQPSSRGLRKPAEISGYHGGDLWVTAAGAAVRHQHDRLAIARHLQAAVHGAVGNDVVAVADA